MSIVAEIVFGNPTQRREDDGKTKKREWRRASSKRRKSQTAAAAVYVCCLEDADKLAALATTLRTFDSVEEAGRSYIDNHSRLSSSSTLELARRPDTSNNVGSEQVHSPRYFAHSFGGSFGTGGN